MRPAIRVHKHQAQRIRDNLRYAQGVLWNQGEENQLARAVAEMGDIITLKLDLISNKIHYFLQKAKRSFAV